MLIRLNRKKKFCLDERNSSGEERLFHCIEISGSIYGVKWDIEAGVKNRVVLSNFMVFAEPVDDRFTSQSGLRQFYLEIELDPEARGCTSFQVFTGAYQMHW